MSFGDAVTRALGRVPTPILDAVANALASGRSPSVVDGGDEVLELVAAASSLPGEQAAAWLRGAMAGYRQGVGTQQVEVVWSGPGTPDVPVRSTAQALADVITAAQQELLLMTYSARPYEPVVVALYAAHTRGVAVDIVVETLSGAGAALSGRESAAAFADIPGVRLWHWPRDQRPTDGAKMHAKIAVADRHIMLVSSVNLTESGVQHSIEAGVVVRGGHAPVRFAEHVEHLRAKGVLRPLS